MSKKKQLLLICFRWWIGVLRVGIRSLYHPFVFLKVTIRSKPVLRKRNADGCSWTVPRSSWSPRARWPSVMISRKSSSKWKGTLCFFPFCMLSTWYFISCRSVTNHGTIDCKIGCSNVTIVIGNSCVWVHIGSTNGETWPFCRIFGVLWLV